MRRLIGRGSVAILAGLFLFLIPIIGQAQTGDVSAAPPPIGQQLIREGTFALKLVPALSLEATLDEAEAESRLAAVGILPRNGWIADYPVTPDIIAELQSSISDAAEAGKLALDRDGALKAFEGVKAELALAVRPQVNGDSYAGTPPQTGNYPDPAVINNYYTEQGPPVVTYYAPPPDYYYLYGWVPSPFWWYGFWFPGFFILNDFHRTVFIHNRPFFVSNHFNDIRRHRVFRIDPGDRFHGRTFAGIGVTHSRGFISTGVPRSGRVIFNGSRSTSPSGVRAITPSGRGSRSLSATPRGSGFSGQQTRGTRMGGTSSRGAGGSMQRGGGSSMQQRGGRR